MWATSPRRASTSLRRDATSSLRGTGRSCAPASMAAVPESEVSPGSVGAPVRSCTQRSSFWPGRRGRRQHQRVGAVAQPPELRFELLEVGEVGHPLRAGPQLARGLRASEHEDSQDGEARGVQSETFVEHLAVSGGRRPLRRVDEAKEASLFERGQRQLDRRLVVGDHWVTVGRLVARQDQGIQREWVVLGRCQLLLRQAADHPCLDLIQFHDEGEPIAVGYDTLRQW